MVEIETTSKNEVQKGSRRTEEQATTGQEKNVTS